MSWLLESRSDAEMPERLIGGVVISRIDVAALPKLGEAADGTLSVLPSAAAGGTGGGKASTDGGHAHPHARARGAVRGRPLGKAWLPLLWVAQAFVALLMLVGLAGTRPPPRRAHGRLSSPRARSHLSLRRRVQVRWWPSASRASTRGAVTASSSCFDWPSPLHDARCYPCCDTCAHREAGARAGAMREEVSVPVAGRFLDANPSLGSILFNESCA